MKMKRFSIRLSWVWVWAICFLLLSGNRPAWSAEQENHCFSCHTNARKLIKITREIEKANKDKPGASTQSEGEG